MTTLLAVNVTRIFDRAARQPAGIAATIALIVLWGVACLLALGQIAYLAIDSLNELFDHKTSPAER